MSNDEKNERERFLKFSFRSVVTKVHDVTYLRHHQLSRRQKRSWCL